MIIQVSQQPQQVRAQYLPVWDLTRCGCHESTACIDQWASSLLRQGRLLAAEPTDVKFKRSYPQWFRTRIANGSRQCGTVLGLKVTAERMPVGTFIRDPCDCWESLLRVKSRKQALTCEIGLKSNEMQSASDQVSEVKISESTQ